MARSVSKKSKDKDGKEKPIKTEPDDADSSRAVFHPYQEERTEQPFKGYEPRHGLMHLAKFKKSFGGDKKDRADWRWAFHGWVKTYEMDEYKFVDFLERPWDTLVQTIHDLPTTRVSSSLGDETGPSCQGFPETSG